MPTVREIRLPAAHPRFRPRIEGSGRTTTHPGTAIRIGEDLFEVVSSMKSGGEWVYRLEPWNADHTIRVYVEWGEEAERRFLDEIRTDRNRGKKKAVAGAFQALIGFLPAKHQERLASSLEFDPSRATFYSAILEILASLPTAVLFGVQLLGAGGRLSGFIPDGAGYFAIAAVADGVVRLVVNVSLQEPFGSLFLAPLGLRLRKEAREDVMGDEFAPYGDSLEVRSPVAKAWWERAGGIMYQSEPFALVDSGREGSKHRYRFKKGGSAFPAADPDLERERNIISGRTYALAPLWGYLPEKDQRAIEFFGRYHPGPYVRASIAVNLILSLSVLVTDLAGAGRGVFGWGNALRLTFAVILLAESIGRLVRHLQNGEVSGSFLGILVKPIYRLAVKAGPAASARTASR